MGDIEYMCPDDDGSVSNYGLGRKLNIDDPRVVEDLFSILNEISQANSVRELHLETKKNFNKTLFQIGGTVFVAGLFWLVSSIVSLNLEVSQLKYKIEILRQDSK